MTEFLDGRVTLHIGDCLKVLDTLEPDSVDAVICDPPYHLHSITKRFAKTGRTESTRSKSGPHQRTAKGFMGKHWDGGTVAFEVKTWRKVIRVLKPGGYIVAFSSSRTFGRMSVAIEDAGFINHPMIGWIFASGMPKSHDAAKAVDRELGQKGTIVPTGNPVKRMIPGADQNKVGWEKNNGREFQPGTYVPATPEAEEWSGYGYGAQALKPALEPIYVGQKPFSERNGASNLMKHGVGAVHIDAGRIEVVDRAAYEANAAGDRGHDQNRTREMDGFKQTAGRSSDLGRWPANVVTDGSPEVLEAFGDAPGAQQPVVGDEPSSKTGAVFGEFSGRSASDRRDGGGSAARFFFSAKANQDDRLGSEHPTVKPIDLMQWLVRLYAPRPGCVVLDPFAGTGTTGEAAWREGMRAILIEADETYAGDIARRMELAENPTKRAAVAKSKNNLQGAEGTPLFEGID